MYPCQKAVLDGIKTNYSPEHETIEYNAICSILNLNCRTVLPKDDENYPKILALNECLRILCREYKGVDKALRTKESDIEDKLIRLKAVLVEEFDAVGIQMTKAYDRADTKNAMDRYMSLLYYRDGILFSINALNNSLKI